jgi:ATP-dependent Clp protease ATP-binding subunit ClpC
VSFAVQKTAVASFPFISIISGMGMKVAGLFFIAFGILFVFTALEAFHRSYYFRGLAQVLRESTDLGHVPAGWGVATIVADTDKDDVVRAFLESEFGQEIMYRAGIREEAFGKYFAERKSKVQADAFIIEKDAGVTLATYAKSIYKQDEEFRHFLAQNNVNADQLVDAARWVTEIERGERQKARFWSRDNLGRIPGIGKTWGYGETYLLDRYGHDLSEDHIWPSALMSRRAENDEVEDLEQILARARQSNALMVGVDMMSVRTRVAQFYHKIREGLILPPLEAKRVFLLDLGSVMSTAPEKPVFEKVIRDIFNQAVTAGNIILYVENFPATVASAAVIGTDLVDIIAPYFESPDIQIIIASDTDTFHARISRDTRVMQAFDVVQMREVGDAGLLNLLEQRALVRERANGIVFSIPALHTIGRLADRYFPTGVMPDKAFDLLEELVPIALSRGIEQVVQSDVEALVYEKTGVPMGDPTKEERQKLLSLEDFLHKRVIGQHDAVTAVAKALRRARAGVGSADKPMGSFLFLGPTGVGKTETAKALAEALFGDDTAMNRLDMSEFQGADALEELIGSYETGQAGRLATMVREKQYGVLLLDEFEKSSRNVHDLFLQVLDEGIFTDAQGKHVNARNLIIIATSNAGASLIWEWEKEGKDIAGQKRVLVDSLVSQGLFRPEFLNRFDDIIVFHPLKKEEVREIAKIQLASLAKRLHDERSIDLTITDALTDAVAAIGYDPQFGGRPMRRAIKDKVEQAVADKLLAGTLVPGDTLTLTADDVTTK